MWRVERRADIVMEGLCGGEQLVCAVHAAAAGVNPTFTERMAGSHLHLTRLIGASWFSHGGEELQNCCK